jgi:hypothetical protein
MISTIGVKLTSSHSADSWLFSKLLGSSLTKVVGFSLFLLALLAFVAAGLSLLGWAVPHELWQQLAIAASILSMVGLALFPHAFPTLFPNVVGALGVDIAVLVSLLWLKWPPEIVGG